MAGKRTLNLSGEDGKTYDLDEIQKQKRDNSEEALIVQIIEYDPSKGESPNPENPKIGQVWLSKKRG